MDKRKSNSKNETVSLNTENSTLSVYNLLFTKPLFNYINNDKLRIVIVGNEEEPIITTLKTLIWCGRFPNVKLSISIAAKKADDFYTTFSQNTYLIDYIKSQNISISTIAISGLVETSIDELGKEFDYSIVTFTNSDYSEAFCKKLNTVFNCENLIDYKKPNENLKRIAQNINFCYELYSDQRKSYVDSVTKFNSPEFDNSSYLSSFATALHVPYKKYIKEILLNNCIDSDEILSKLEHERWNAYELTEGYSQLSLEDIHKNIMNGGNHKKDKQHGCLCDYGNNEIILDKNDNLWKKYDSIEDITSDAKLSELDKMSLVCYVSYGELLFKSTKYINEALSKNFSEEKFGDFKKCVNKLINRDFGAINTLNNYISCLNNENDKNKIDAFFEKYKILINANKKTDYKAYDMQLVKMSQFCEWYDRDYTTLVIICSENNINNIIFPTVLLPRNIVFVTSDNMTIDEEIKKYLRIRNLKCKIDIKNLDSDKLNFDNCEYELKKLFGEFKENDVIICLADGIKPHIAATVGSYAFVNNYPCISSVNGNMIHFSYKNNICPAINDFNISADEMIELANWEFQNSKEPIPISFVDCQKLSDLFFDYAKSNRYKVDDKIHYYTVWDRFSKCYIKDEILKKNDVVEFECKDKYNMPEVTLVIEDLAKNFLSKLSDMHIIRILNDDLSNIRYEIQDEKTYNVLSNKSGELFEWFVFYKFLYSGLFTDIKSGAMLKSNNIEGDKIDNEIDVIAINKFTPYLVSCKTIADYKGEAAGNKVVYEIASEARVFNGVPILAVSRTLSGPDKETEAGAERIIERAKISKVHLIDANILRNDTYFYDAIKRIVKNEDIVSPDDYNG